MVVLLSAPIFSKEIIGSGEDGIVYHRDMVRQNAQPGDVMKREIMGKKVLYVIEASDINFSVKAYERIQQQLKAEIRPELNNIYKQYNMEYLNNIKPSEPDWPIDEKLLKGHVSQFISDISERKQRTIIVCKRKEKSYWTRKYQGKPYMMDSNNLPPDLIMIAYVKPINKDANDIYSYTEDVSGIKSVLKLIQNTPKEVAPPPKPPRAPIDWFSYFPEPGLGYRVGSPMIIPAVGYMGWLIGDMYWFIFTLGGDVEVNGEVVNVTHPWETDLWSTFTPGLTINGNSTFTFDNGSFLELGADMSLFNPQGVDGSKYLSLYPYAHYNFVSDQCYFGLGSGRMFTLIGNAERLSSYDTIHDTFAIDILCGFGGASYDDDAFDTQFIFRFDFEGGFYFNIMFGYHFDFF
jgi:hypothetical protein